MCGPAMATPSVQKALKAAVATHGKMGEEAAEQWLAELLRNMCYSVESYCGGDLPLLDLHTAERQAAARPDRASTRSRLPERQVSGVKA